MVCCYSHVFKTKSIILFNNVLTFFLIKKRTISIFFFFLCLPLFFFFYFPRRNQHVTRRTTATYCVDIRICVSAVIKLWIKKFIQLNQIFKISWMLLFILKCGFLRFLTFSCVLFFLPGQSNFALRVLIQVNIGTAEDAKVHDVITKRRTPGQGWNSNKFWNEM